MKNNQKRFKLSQKGLVVGIIGILLAVSLFGWWAFLNLTPRPLGDKLEYLGKDSYGCWHGYCDSRLTYIYYYTTDMRPSELAAYFKKATTDEAQKDKINSLNQDSEPDGFFYLKAPGGDSFYIEYISNNQKTPEERGIKQPTKKYLVSISEEGYEAAKNAL